MKPAVADNPIRQAAVLMRSLAPETAAAMLTRLSPEEARALRDAVRETGDVGAEERERIAGLLQGSRKNSSESREVREQPADEGGVELRLSGATRQAPQEQSESDNASQWFRSVLDADPRSIAAYLIKEHPRAVALVLTYLPPDLAAGVLAEFPETEQATLLTSLAQQGEADPGSARVVAAGLSKWLREQNEQQERRVGRMASIRELLAATPPEKRVRLLAGIRDQNPDIADELKGLIAREPQATVRPSEEQHPAPTTVAAAPPRLEFDQLHRLDDRALAEAIGALDGRTALLAMAAAEDPLMQKITARLSRKDKQLLQKRIVSLGPMSLAEVDEAQRELCRSAERIVRRRRQARPAASTDKEG